MSPRARHLLTAILTAAAVLFVTLALVEPASAGIIFNSID